MESVEKSSKSVKESTLKVQAVKSMLQGGPSSIRNDSLQQSESQHSKDSRHNIKDDKQTKQKKRNLLEVFKKTSNAKDIGKSTKQRPVVDKFELECIEVLKVCIFHSFHFFFRTAVNPIRNY